MKDDCLADLIRRLDAGEPVDWEEAEATAGDEESKARVRALSEVARIATAHRELVVEEPPLLGAGDRWGPLVIEGRLGAGSFGAIYRARDPNLDRTVALKLLQRRRLPPAQPRALFTDGPTEDGAILAEGRMLARVKHRNVAVIHGADSHDGRVGLWMELIAGETLAERVRREGPLSAERVAEIGADLAAALAAVHAAGILHRDVKAQNVMLEPAGGGGERTVLMDFGIGRDLAAEAEDDGAISGTPLYLAPEALAGQRATVPSDVYSLGVLLYHLASGAFPIVGDSLQALRQAHQESRAVPLAERCSQLPTALLAVVERCLESRPEARYPSMEEVGEALAALAKSGGRRRSWLGWVAALILLAGLAGYFAYSWAAVHGKMQPTTSSRVALRLYAAGDRQMQAEEYERAFASFTDALRADPRFALARARLSELLAGESGNYQEAFAESKSAIEEQHRRGADGHPLSGCEGHYIEASAASLVLDYARAAEAYRSAATACPREANFHRQLSLTLLNLGDYAGAVNAAKEAVDLNPGSPTDWGILIIALAKQGRIDEARRRFQEAERRFAGGGESSAYLTGWAGGFVELLADGDHRCGRAREAFGELTSEGSVYRMNGYLLLAQTEVDCGNPDEAIGYLLTARRVSEQEDAEARTDEVAWLLADLYRYLGRIPEAREQLALLAGLGDLPTFAKALRARGVLAAQLGELELARSTAEELRTIARSWMAPTATGAPAPPAPATAFALQVQGEIDLAAGKLEAAEVSLSRANRLFPDPSNALSLCRLYAARGDCARLASLSRELRTDHRGWILHDFSAVILPEAERLAAGCGRF